MKNGAFSLFDFLLMRERERERERENLHRALTENTFYVYNS